MTDAQAAVPIGGSAGSAGSAIPDFKQLDHKDLLERLATANRERQDEHQKFNRTLTQVQTQARVDLERLRATTAVHTKDLEAQVSALLKSLSRLQADVERLERENLTLQVTSRNGHAEPLRESAAGIPSLPGHAT
jgi:uncharacterized protein (DUF3084 family)